MVGGTNLSSRFDRALQLASELHRRQRRKGSPTPYIAHLLAVCAIVLENGGDEDQAIAALLHDAVEDQGGLPTLDRIREEFGESVAGIVKECSDNEGRPDKPWRERKEAYIEHLEHLGLSARLVSLADKIHNARSILTDYRREGECLWSRFNGKREGTLWYYQGLRDKILSVEQSDLAREFQLVVDELLRVTKPQSG